METSFTFRDIESTEALKNHVLDKFTKLDKYLIKPISAHTVLCKDGSEHKVEITLVANGVRYVGIDKTHDMYLSIDHAVEKLVTQLKKAKEKLKDHHKR